jgi:hypothetical protein
MNLEARTIDIGVVTLANLVNLMMAGLFIGRATGHPRIEQWLGILVVAAAVPAAAAIWINAAQHRPGWTILLPVPLILFCLFELLLDFVLHVPFRTGRLLGPYLAIYYLALLALIGYAFGTARSLGFLTLATYFLNLIATGYAHSGGRASG